MNQADIRYLFDYDRWATRRVLAVIDGLPEAVWGATGVVGDRGLGAILVAPAGGAPALAARACRERGAAVARTPATPLPGRAAAAWALEWDALEAWLPTLTDAWLAELGDGVPFWQMLAHVVNHGTQHRSEAATLLTGAGRSPGDLDMIFFAEELPRPAHGRLTAP